MKKGHSHDWLCYWLIAETVFALKKEHRLKPVLPKGVALR
jgi:hypothetical protein